MDAQKFAEAYPKATFDPEARFGPEADTFLEAQHYAEVFSAVLHDELSGNTDDDTNMAIKSALSQYPVFIRHGLRELDTKLFTDGTDKSIEKLSEINFHWLNYAMLPMWALLLDAEVVGTAEERREVIKHSQDMLAYDGCFQYTYRDRLSSKESDYRYFQEDMAGIRSVVEGRLHERDAAIALLDIAKNDPSIVVVPAPGKFEHSGNGSVNADFVVIDTTQRKGVGVQVKSQVHTEDLQRYSGEQIMLIDGFIDLGNTRSIRTSSRKSAPKNVSWAGVISTDHMKRLQTHGKNATRIANMYPIGDVLKAQFNAKIRLGGMKVDRRHIADLLETRLREKL